MPDAIFPNPRLAPLYDAFEGERDDLEAYVRIAEELGASRVLDVGCGTGTLALILAAREYTVSGVDPDETSLDVARAKSGAENITWIHGDATSLPPMRADLTVMTANVAQVFLTDDDWRVTLRAIHDALAPGGHLVFETRRPEYRAWEEWTRDTEPVRIDIPGIGEVEQTFALADVDLPYVSFTHTYRFARDGEVITSASTLIFRTAEQITASLTACGFDVREVRDAADRPGREYVFVAQREN